VALLKEEEDQRIYKEGCVLASRHSYCVPKEIMPRRVNPKKGQSTWVTDMIKGIRGNWEGKINKLVLPGGTNVGT